VGVIREAGWRPSENFSLYLGEAYLVAGELDKAQESLRTTLELAEECGMRFFVGSCHRLLGEVALRGASDRLVAAREHFERSIATLSEINAENELAAAELTRAMARPWDEVPVSPTHATTSPARWTSLNGSGRCWSPRGSERGWQPCRPGTPELSLLLAATGRITYVRRTSVTRIRTSE